MNLTTHLRKTHAHAGERETDRIQFRDTRESLNAHNVELLKDKGEGKLD